MGITFSISRASGRSPWLSSEVSYPRLAHGHNIGVLDLDGFNTAKALHEEAILTLPFNSNLPRIDDWSVSRMDLSHAWRVADPSSLITDIGLYVRGRIRSKESFYSGDSGSGATVAINQKCRKRILYDKGAEVRSKISDARDDPGTVRRLLEFSDGVIKFESTARRRRIRDVLFNGDMRAGDLALYLSTRAFDDLRKDLLELIRSWSPTKESEVFTRIRASFKPGRAKTLFGLYTGIQATGIAYYREKVATSSEIFRRDLADLESAGVGFGDIAHTIKLEIPSGLTVWCRDLDLYGSSARGLAA